MSDTNETTVNKFTQGLDDLGKKASDLQSVLSRTLQALTKHGLQLSVDLNAMVQDLQNDIASTKTLSRRVTKQIDQQDELVRTIALITSSLELDEVLAEVMDTVIQLTGAERAYLMLKNEGDDELTIRAARNWDRESISDNDAQFSSSIVNQVLSSLEPVMSFNAQTDERFEGALSVAEQGLRSILCIPLAMQGRAVGVLYADNRIDQGIFDQNDVPLLTAFGTQAAIAIQNARQYGRVQDNLRETQRELEDLKIQIDRVKVHEQVSEITDSEYFEHLTQAARELRERVEQKRAGQE